MILTNSLFSFQRAEEVRRLGVSLRVTQQVKSWYTTANQERQTYSVNYLFFFEIPCNHLIILN